MLPKPALRSKDDDDDEDAPPRMLSTVIKLPPHLAILDEVHIDARYAGSVCKAITKTAEQVSRMHDCRWDIMYGLQFPSGDLAHRGTASRRSSCATRLSGRTRTRKPSATLPRNRKHEIIPAGLCLAGDRAVCADRWDRGAQAESVPALVV